VGHPGQMWSTVNGPLVICLPRYNGCVKRTIFVVEDEADISRLVRHQLETAGFAVREFPAAGRVLVEALREPPSLFLLDIMVPGTDGLELCRRIRQTPGLASIPVIFLTAKSGEADRIAAPVKIRMACPGFSAISGRRPAVRRPPITSLVSPSRLRSA
jgi:CheY-like chemotaxis protein